MTDLQVKWHGQYNKEHDQGSYPFTHQSEYALPSLPFSLERIGIFKYLEDAFFERPINGVINLHHAVNFLPDQNQKVYKLQTLTTSTQKKNLLIAFLLDDIFQPVALLEDTTKRLVSRVDLKNYENIYIHVEYGIKTLRGKNIEYFHHFLQKYSELIGRKILFAKYPDLVKNLDMRHWDYYEGNLTWYYSDSFLKHFCLSRGAGLVEFLPLHSFTQEQTIQLSPFHQIVIGRLKEAVHNEKLKLAREMGEEFFTTRREQVRGENQLLYNFFCDQ